MKCIYCKGQLGEGWKPNFHYICQARNKRGIATPKLDPPKPMTDEEVNTKLAKAGLALNQFKIIG